jgi:hypothetical protein
MVATVGDRRGRVRSTSSSGTAPTGGRSRAAERPLRRPVTVVSAC